MTAGNFSDATLYKDWSNGRKDLMQDLMSENVATKKFVGKTCIPARFANRRANKNGG
ncbi:MAG TPA: hypothetical protein VIO58_14580 [Candidatus Methanoperedens sp.]